MARFLTELNPSSPDPAWDAPRSLPIPVQSSPPLIAAPGNVDSENVDSENVDSRNVDSGNVDSENVDSGNFDSENIGFPKAIVDEKPAPDRVIKRQTADRSLEATTLEAAAESAAEPQETGFGAVLRNLNFMRLWSGQVFSQIADKVYLVLMIMMISHRFESPEQSISSWVSAIMVAFTVPAILLGSIAGVYADRHRKKNILVLSNFLRSAFVFSLPLLLPLSQGISLQHIPLGFYILLSVTFLVSSLTQFFAPAEQAIIPLIVEKSALLSANSLYTTTMMGAMIVGFAVGEPLLDWANHWLAQIVGWGSGEVLFVGSCYALAGITLLGVVTSEPLSLHSDDRPHPSVWQEIRGGWQYLGQNLIVRSALLQLVVLFSVFAALAVLAVRLAEVIPQLDSDQFGWLLAIGSLGMGLGAFIVGHSGDRLDRFTLVRTGSLGMALSLLGLAIVIHQTALNQLMGTLLCITSLGLFAALIGIPLQTTIQEETPADMRGKVFGLQNNGVNIALSLPLVLASVAEQSLGLSWTFGLLAIGVLLGIWLQPQSSAINLRQDRRV